MLPFYRLVGLFERQVLQRTAPVLNPYFFLPHSMEILSHPQADYRQQIDFEGSNISGSGNNHQPSDVNVICDASQLFQHRSSSLNRFQKEEIKVNSHAANYSTNASKFRIENLLKDVRPTANNENLLTTNAKSGDFQITADKSYKLEKRKRPSKNGIVKQSREKKKPFICEVCNCSFSKMYNLNTHMRKHTDERPFNCSICQKKFRRKDHLKDHEFTHASAKPYTCSICNKGFCQYRAHDNHVIRHHPNSTEFMKIMNKRHRSSLKKEM